MKISRTSVHSQILDKKGDGERKATNMIVFLTDGLPTAGELQTKEEIRTAIKARNRDSKIRVHALAFGDDADYPAMKELAGDSGGLAR